MVSTGSTTRQLLKAASTRLAAAGVGSPEYDAAELLAQVLGVPRPEILRADSPTERQRAAYERAVARRAGREPLQYIIGVAGFRHVELAVGPGVFVPRPETEVLAGWAIEAALAVSEPGGRPPVVVDLCTGSGAIALAVADEVTDAEVHAVEVEPAAFEWASTNLAGTDVDLRLGDMTDAFPELSGSVDVVVCNPPYIPLDAFDSVEPEARDFDPPASLWSGEDGLEAIRAVERVGARLLRDGGQLGVEHADVQGTGALAVFAATGRWSRVLDHQDLAGRPRFVTAEWHDDPMMQWSRQARPPGSAP